MPTKRKRDGDDEPTARNDGSKKVKRGFQVGPDRLPEGSWRRKTQKIKGDLIERARIKKNFAKLKRQGKIQDEAETLPQPASMTIEDGSHEPTNTPHPARQALIEQEEASPGPQQEERTRRRKPKPAPFQKEYEQAQRRKAEAEERQKAREQADRQRREKIEERERMRKAMARARTAGPNGQRKLGRESKVLLDRVKRQMGEGG